MSANAGAPLVFSTAQNKAMTQLTPRGCCWSCTREERGGRKEAGEVWRARCTRRKGSVGPKALSSSKTPLPRAPVHRRPPPAADQDDHGRPRPLGPQALSEWRANKEAPTAKSKKDDGSNVGRHTRQKKKKNRPAPGAAFDVNVVCLVAASVCGEGTASLFCLLTGGKTKNPPRSLFSRPLTFLSHHLTMLRGLLVFVVALLVATVQVRGGASWFWWPGGG